MLAAHARIPELLQMIGDRGDRLVVWLMREELADLVGHVGQLVRRHVAPAATTMRSGWVKTSKPSARAMPTSVMPACSAMRTASAVGADTATTTGAPSIAAFCTISTEMRLDSSSSPSATGNAIARQCTRQLVERIVPADILAQCDETALRMPEGGGMHRVRLLVELLRSGKRRHRGVDRSRVEARRRKRCAAACAPHRPGFPVRTGRSRSGRQGDAGVASSDRASSGASHMRSSMPARSGTMSSSSIAAASRTMPSVRLKPTAKSSRSAGVASITA